MNDQSSYSPYSGNPQWQGQPQQQGTPPPLGQNQFPQQAYPAPQQPSSGFGQVGYNPQWQGQPQQQGTFPPPGQYQPQPPQPSYPGAQQPSSGFGQVGYDPQWQGQPQQQGTPPPMGQYQPQPFQPSYPGAQQPPLGFGQAAYPNGAFGQANPAKQNNIGVLLAGIGGAVAFLAFFLPYVTVSAIIVNISISGLTFASGSALVGGTRVGGIAIFWVEPLLALVAVGLVASTYLNKQPKPGQLKTIGIWSLVVGLIGALGHLLFVGGAIALLSSIGAGWGIGAIFYLLGMISTIVGGIMTMRR